MTQPAASLGLGDVTRAASLLAVVYAISGLLMPFLTVWLAFKGVDPRDIAMTQALGLVARAVIGLGFGLLASLLPRSGLLIVAAGISAGLAFSGAWLSDAHAFVVTLVALAVGLVYGTMPLAETFANTIGARPGHNYGHIRMWGSVAFLAANIAGGMALERPNALFLAPGIIVFLCVCLSGIAPTRLGERERGRLQSFPGMARVLCLLIPAMLLNASHAYYYAFGVLRWIEHGISPGLTGILWALAVIAEILVFRLASEIVRHYATEHILFVCGLVASGRWLTLSLNPSIPYIVVSQFCHAFSFALAYQAAMAVIRNDVPAEMQPFAQAIYALACSGVALAAFTAALPMIQNQLHIDPYVAMAILAGSAALIGAAFGRMFDPRKFKYGTS
jgi:PPP family 3-phenylpropionic acid transporter